MRNIRTFSALLLLIVFSCYYSGISMFSHTHSVHGTSIVHSHLGGGAEHSHSDSQYAVIDILSHFQSVGTIDFCHVGIPFFQLSESYIGYESSSLTNRVCPIHTLRGPPQE